MDQVGQGERYLQNSGALDCVLNLLLFYTTLCVTSTTLLVFYCSLPVLTDWAGRKLQHYFSLPDEFCVTACTIGNRFVFCCINKLFSDTNSEQITRQKVPL